MKLITNSFQAKLGFIRKFLFDCALLLVGLSSCIGYSIHAEPVTLYETQIEGGASGNFDYAIAQLWVSPPCHVVRGVLCIVLHPLGQRGSRLAHPGPWIDLARREHCALMAISFAPSNDPTRNWCCADQGSGRALLTSLDVLARKSGIASLSTAHLVMAGVCAAGQFGFHFAAFAPGRVTSFVTIGGGKHDLSKIGLASSASALVVVTPDRGVRAVQNLQSLYACGHALTASWKSVSEPIAKYDAGYCSSNVISFLQSALAHLWTSDHSIVVDKVNAPTRYLPISICGEKLSLQAIALPTRIILPQSTPPSSVQTCFFDVERIQNSSIDAINILTQSDAVRATAVNIGTGKWRVRCVVNQEKLLLGTSNLELSIRFLKQGSQVLGGIKETLTDFVEGDLRWNPRNIDFGVLTPGMPSSVRIQISSKYHIPIVIEQITCKQAGVKIASHIGTDGDSELWCTATPSACSQGTGFSGYLEVKLKSPHQRSLRIFYYGSIKA